MKNVRKFYDCSIGHLPRETAVRMESGTWPSVSMQGEFGFLVHVPEKIEHINELVERGMDCPVYLKIVQFAQDAECDYILFDRDVDPVEYLEFFEW